MKIITVALAVLSFGHAAATKSESPLMAELLIGVKKHPIAKVVKLLEELKTKAIEEGEEESEGYQKFKNWCDDSMKELGDQIKKEKDDIEVMEKEVSAKKELISTLESDIEFLTKQLEEQTMSGDEAKKIREDTKKAYEEADKDYDSTIEAIEDCIKALDKAKGFLLSTHVQSVRRVLALAEGLVSDKEHIGMLKSLSAMTEEPKVQDEVYTFKSGSVIELLEGLKKKFEEDKDEATRAETASLADYNSAKDARKEAIKAAEKAKEEKSDLKGETEEELTELEGDLEETKEDMAANEKTLEETTAECKMKADEFKDRTFMRAQEIKAIESAIDILSKVLGVKAPELLQKPVSLLQIDDPKAKAVKILVSESQKLHHSKALENLIKTIKKHKGGPFDEINQMIQKMIFRLMAEQKDEDEHYMWCETETEKATGEKEHNEEKKEELEKKIDLGDKKTQELTDEIAEAEKEVTRLATEIKEATEIRNEEKEENMQAIQDSQDAQKAVAKAVAVLDEFYEKAGSSFIQRGPVELGDKPETWGSSYNGVSDPRKQPGGIITVLEKVAEDYAKFEADTKAQEASDQKAFDEELTTNSIDKAEHEKSVELKTHAKARLQEKLKNWNKKLKFRITELEAVEAYMERLEHACEEGEDGATYEDRKKARTEEIDALREVQNILTDAFKFYQVQDSKFLQKKVIVKSHQ